MDTRFYTVRNRKHCFKINGLFSDLFVQIVLQVASMMGICPSGCLAL